MPHKTSMDTKPQCERTLSSHTRLWLPSIKWTDMVIPHNMMDTKPQNEWTFFSHTRLWTINHQVNGHSLVTTEGWELHFDLVVVALYQGSIPLRGLWIGNTVNISIFYAEADRMCLVVLQCNNNIKERNTGITTRWEFSSCLNHTRLNTHPQGNGHNQKTLHVELWGFEFLSEKEHLTTRLCWVNRILIMLMLDWQ